MLVKRIVNHQQAFLFSPGIDVQPIIDVAPVGAAKVYEE